MTTSLHTDLPFVAAAPALLQSLIEEFATITSAPALPGVTRLAYTPTEREAHRVFAERMSAMGLSVRVDAAGNTIAELVGSQPELPAVGTGSHLDSVPQGGRFDGMAGVAAAIAAAESLSAMAVRPRRTIRFIAFAAEEGARFGQACIGSRLIAGLTSAADLDDLIDADGVSVAASMRDVGIDPGAVSDAVWPPAEMHGFLELHIEQGVSLSTAGIAVGVVDIVSGSTRLAFEVTGRASHTGGTPMHLRADALAASAEIVLAAETLSNQPRYSGTRITVGKLEVEPGSITTIPGRCRVFVDVRDVDSERQRAAADELVAFAFSSAEERQVGISVRLLADTSPVSLPISIQELIVDCARDLGVDYQVMASGASHDTQMINRVCPSGIIFVPSLADGVSHAPEEFTDFGDLAVGTTVLTLSLLRLAEAP